MVITDLQSVFMNYVSSYASKDTYYFYNNVFNVFYEFLNNRDINCIDFCIDCLNDDMLVSFIKYLRFEKKVKNVSVRTYVRAVKVFDNYCFNNGYKLEKIGSVKLPKDDRQLKIPLSVREVDLLVSAIENMHYSVVDRNLCIFYLMLDCGLRLQEVCNLQLSDINFDLCVLYVQNSKNNKSRVVPVPSDLISLLKHYLMQRDSNSKYVFIMSNGCVLTKSAVKNMFRKLKAIVPRVHAHLLRHTFATSYIMGGGSLEVLRVLLGHSSYNVTQFYISQATEMSISHYDIYRINDVFFDKFSYR